ncbi:M20 aminoacylase family protein [Arenibaculum pallidiluteum]|uniref:M20 aminoacylase family protein n=1 Tax=Arenibaculum pallidiluteum TaxID=2812559 RepID=UPI001A96B0A0|nr:M20 aminoacylase family protein [Arenibaculum pallidiluteum]
MPIINRIAEFHADMTAWRRDFHAHPELGFEEFRTAEKVAALLTEWGIEVHRGLGVTGVVGTLHGAHPARDTGAGRPKVIALRADMDALPMQEENDFAHASTVPGKMHACGHDGHTTMLLGAARYLAETRNFAGTVRFIFQPAEEGRGGALRMIEDGLLEKLPFDEVYGLHNWPEMPAGIMAMRPGPMMAAADLFDITVSGRGGHGAMPHHSVDPVVVASQIVTALQTLVSRGTDPMDNAVVSVTRIHAGSAYNVIPGEARLSGTVRSFRPETRDRLEAGIRRISEGVAAALEAAATVDYRRNYPPTLNTPAETDFAAGVATRMLGEAAVMRDFEPSMGAEDFAFMLERTPGCYAWIGQAGGGGGCMVHNPRYDFNDEILPLGASYWANLVEAALPREVA